MFSKKYNYLRAFLLFFLVFLTFCTKPGLEPLQTSGSVTTSTQIPMGNSIIVKPSIPAQPPLTPTWTATFIPDFTNTSEPSSTPNLGVLTPSSTLIPTQIYYPLPGLSYESAAITGNQPLTKMVPSEAFTLLKIHFINEKYGWALDTKGHILRTDSGGLTWKDATPPFGAYVNQGFYPLDENQAWATPLDTAALNCIRCPTLPPSPSQGIIWRTEDAGQTWQASQPLEIGYNGQTTVEAYIPMGISFTDPIHGWLLINTMRLMNHDWLELFRTNDGGLIWEKLYSPDSPNSSDLPCDGEGIVLLDPLTGYLGGSCYKEGVDEKWWIRYSTDGGVLVITQTLPAPDNLTPEFTDGNSTCGAGTIISTSPGSLGFPFYCQAYDAATGQYFSTGFFYYSGDGGQSWITFDNPYSLDFINGSIGWKLQTLSSQPGRIDRTNDGGRHWETLKNVNWQGQLDFVSESVGWALATDGIAIALLHTIDGGMTWEILTPVIIN